MEDLRSILKTTVVHSVQVGTKVIDVVKFMAEKSVGLVPVLDGDKLVGVFSERDLVKRIIAIDKDVKETIVDDVMSTNLVIAKVNETPAEALAKMKQAGTRHILVIDNEKLIGVLSMRDLLEVDLLQCKTTVEVLNNYIYSK
ncbi:MAG: CBS domain-containing protein [Ignavibacterium sp.]|nr:CBS domain-containing protein [Ignavibacterium sp.]MDW8376035.1 CBS domain-containing protein [Ignavibacteriales bacterium]